MSSIVWSDTRADKELVWILDNIGSEKYHRISGVPVSGLWTYAKIKWFIDNKRDIFEKTYKILNGQEYFLHKLGSDEISTDPSSITMNGMLDVDNLTWSKELCELISLPFEKLPPMGTPARMVGKISKEASEKTGFSRRMPIAIGGGDQQCTAIGTDRRLWHTRKMGYGRNSTHRMCNLAMVERKFRLYGE
jgi:xylulokinase